MDQTTDLIAKIRLAQEQPFIKGTRPVAMPTIPEEVPTKQVDKKPLHDPLFQGITKGMSYEEVDRFFSRYY